MSSSVIDVPPDVTDQVRRLVQLLQADRERVTSALRSAGRDIREFQRVSNVWIIRYLLICWGAIAVTGFAWSVLMPGWKLALLPVLAITQHAMLNVVHEASHYSLLRSRRWNDRLGNWLFALPIGHTVGSYRLTHADHHAYLRTPKDPSSYVTDPGLTSVQVRRTLAFLLLGRLVWELVARSLLGRRFRPEAAANKASMQDTDRRRLAAIAAFHIPAGALCYSLGIAGFWLAWLLVVMTITPTLDGLRTIVEHRLPASEVSPFHTRSHHRSLIVSGLMSPFFQYHWEHHLFPGVPHPRLAQLHRELLRLDVAGAQAVEGGFFGALFRVV